MLGTVILVIVLMIFAFAIGILIYANLKLRQKIESLKAIVGTPVPARQFYTRADRTIFDCLNSLQEENSRLWNCINRINRVQERTDALWEDRYGAESNRDDATANEVHIHAED